MFYRKDLHDLWALGDGLHARGGEWCGRQPHLQPAWTEARGPSLPLLFNLVMDVLHLIIERAANEGLLSGLTERGLRHPTLMYADDVVTFV
jgi:hypothetical protein